MALFFSHCPESRLGRRSNILGKAAAARAGSATRKPPGAGRDSPGVGFNVEAVTTSGDHDQPVENLRSHAINEGGTNTKGNQCRLNGEGCVVPVQLCR